MSFLDKVVIVTGAGSGIGAAAALLFAKNGAEITIVDRNESQLNKVAAQISGIGKKPLIINADVFSDDAKTIVAKTVAEFGKLNVLVNNAGILKLASVGDDKLMEVYDEVVNINLRSIVALTNLAVPHLAKTKGNVVNTSSVVGASAFAGLKEGYLAYCISKAGLNQFTRYAAKELAPKGIRINAVSPGPVQTSIMENTVKDLNWELAKKFTMLNIVSQPEEVADLILYLASDKARCITGSNYTIDCGISLV